MGSPFASVDEMMVFAGVSASASTFCRAICLKSVTEDDVDEEGDEGEEMSWWCSSIESSCGMLSKDVSSRVMHCICSSISSLEESGGGRR